MKKYFTLLIFCCISALLGNECIQVPVQNGSIKLDGTLNAEKWSRAAEISTLLCMNPDPQVMDKAGGVFLVADDKFLYFGISTAAKNNDPGGGLVADAIGRDGAVYNDDSVEVMLAPDSNQNSAYHLIINSKGAVFDRSVKYTPGELYDIGYDCLGLEIASEVRGGIWNLELKIPRTSVGNPQKGFKFNVARNWSGFGASALSATRNHLDRDTMIEAKLASDVPTVRMKDSGDIRGGVWTPTLEVGETSLPLNCSFLLKRHKNYADPGTTVLARSNVLNRNERFTAAYKTASRDLYSLEILVRDAQSGKTVFQRRFFGCKGTNRGNIPFSQEFEVPDVISGFLYYYPGMNKACCMLSPGPEAPISNAKLEFQEQEIPLTFVNGDWNGKFDTPTTLGTYPANLVLKMKDGKELRTNAIFSIVKKTFPWENNRLGTEKIILPPFSPLTQKAGTVSMLLRRYQFGPAGLPASICAIDRELLTRPIHYRLTADGRTSVLKGEPAKVILDDTGYSGIVKGTASSPEGIKLLSEGKLEYDGFYYQRVTLENPKKQKIERLTLVIPLKDAECPLYHIVAPDSIRQNPSGIIPAGTGVVWSGDMLSRGSIAGIPTTIPQFVPYIWLGAERRGLCFFMDSSWGLRLQEKVPAVRLIRDHGELTLEVDLINRASQLSKDHSFEFGFQATPVKTADPRLREYYQSMQPLVVPEMKSLIELSEAVCGYNNRWAKQPLHDDWTLFDDFIRLAKSGKGYESYLANLKKWDIRNASSLRSAFSHLPRVDKRDYFQWWIDCRQFTVDRILPEIKRPVSLMKYSDPTLCTYMDDTFQYYKTEWVSRPTGYLGASRAFLVPSYLDYVVYSYAKEMEHGLTGVYMDDMFLISCHNPETLARTDDEGQLHAPMGILAMRELIKRVSVLQHQRGCTPRYLQIHMTNAQLVPSFSFATSLLGWEDFYGEDEFQKRFTQGYIRAESLGTQLGAEFVALDGIMRRKYPVADWMERFEFLTRTQMALLLPNGIKLWQRVQPPTAGAHRETIYKVFGILGGFRIWECEFIPWFDRDPRFGCNAPEVTLSIYRHPEGRLLMLLGNLGKTTTLRLRADLEKLGVPADAKFIDAETGKELNDQSLTLNEFDFAMILVGKNFPQKNVQIKELSIPANFQLDSNEVPAGWAINRGQEFQPLGSLKVITEEGKPGVKLKSAGKYFAIFTTTQIPAQAGDVFRIRSTASGKGRYAVGFYQYGSAAQWQWRGELAKWRKGSLKPRDSRDEFTIRSGDVQHISVMLAVDAGAEIRISDLHLEKVISQTLTQGKEK